MIVELLFVTTSALFCALLRKLEIEVMKMFFAATRLLFFLILILAVKNVISRSIHCRDPGLGSHNTPKMRANEKKFLVMGGVGKRRYLYLKMHAENRLKFNLCNHQVLVLEIFLFSTLQRIISRVMNENTLKIHT